MRRPRRFGRRRSGISKLRPLEWRGTVPGVYEVAPGTVLSLNMLSAASLSEYTSPTLIRTVGTIVIAPAATLAATQYVYGTLGLMVTPDVTLVPTDFEPSVTPDKKWMLWKPWALLSNGSDATFKMDLDLTVRRKVNQDQDVNFYLDTRTASFAAARVMVAMRFLIAD